MEVAAGLLPAETAQLAAPLCQVLTNPANWLQLSTQCRLESHQSDPLTVL